MPVSNTIGRPTVITPAIVQKLEQALMSGFTVETACNLSGIARATYYDHVASDDEFSDKMDRAKAWPTEKARKTVVAAIEAGDLQTSKWWLERKARSEFSASSRDTPFEPAAEIDDGHKALREIAQTIKQAWAGRPPFAPGDLDNL